MTEVSQSVRDVAVKAVAGIMLTKAEIEEKASGTICELNGEADGKKRKIKVTPEGKVIKFEIKNSEGKDDDGDKKAKNQTEPIANAAAFCCLAFDHAA